MTTATTVMAARDVTIGDTFVRISGQGLPLVFVHSFTTTSEFWKEQAEEFSKAYRVIRIDLPGHGDSPAPISRSYRLEDFVEDVARVFRELSIEEAVLIGLSMGGIVAQKFALNYRHLVKALVLVDTTAHGIGPDATADAFLAIVDKRGLKKAVQDLSDISFSSSPRRRFSNGRDEKSFKPRNSSPGQRFARSMTPIRAALCPKSKCLRW